MRIEENIFPIKRSLIKTNVIRQHIALCPNKYFEENEVLLKQKLPYIMCCNGDFFNKTCRQHIFLEGNETEGASIYGVKIILLDMFKVE